MVVNLALQGAEAASSVEQVGAAVNLAARVAGSSGERAGEGEEVELVSVPASLHLILDWNLLLGWGRSDLALGLAPVGALGCGPCSHWGSHSHMVWRWVG